MRKVESRFVIHGKNYFCHCCSSIHLLQTTTKRPPSLTLTGARIFKQRLATIRKHRIGSQGALSIQPKISVISVGTSNGTDHFGLVRPEYSGPALKVVLFDRSGHFGRSDRNVPFHLTKLLSPVPLFCILLARTITKRAVAWVGSVEPDCTVPLNTENFRNFKPEFLLNGKRPRARSQEPESSEQNMKNMTFRHFLR